MTARTLTLIRPDDWHLHFRDDEALRTTVPLTAHQFGRALAMPNLKPPVTTVAQAEAYRARVLAALPAHSRFTPLFALYLTDNTDADEVKRARDAAQVLSFKLYPAGATTNSDFGVTAMNKVHKVLAAMEREGVPLCVHGEDTHADVDVFDREKVFIDKTLIPVLKNFPALRVVFEHITTRDAAQFVRDTSHDVAATLTPQHLLLNRNAIFQGGIRPHLYCLPVLKREEHRQALLAAATSGNPRFFLGTDSAPHARPTKEAACGCAGIFSAHVAIELYAEAFDSVQALDKLEGFASLHGADWYRLPRNSDTITLINEAQTVVNSLPYCGTELVPFRAGETLAWRMQ